MSFHYEESKHLLIYTPFGRGGLAANEYAIGSSFAFRTNAHCRRKLSRTEAFRLIHGSDFFSLTGFDSKIVARFLANQPMSHRDLMVSAGSSSRRELDPKQVSDKLIRQVMGLDGQQLFICEYVQPKYRGYAPNPPPVKPPKKKPPKVPTRAWVEFLILDQDDNPVPGIKGRIDTVENTCMFARTDQDGRIYFADLPGDQCTFRFWTSEGNQRHTATDGDCYLSLAATYQVNPLAIWRGKRNQDLFSKRENPNVLHPGDEIHIPEELHNIGPVKTQASHTYRIHDPRCDLRLRVDLSEVTSAPTVRYQITLKSGETLGGEARTGGPNRPTILRVPAKAMSGCLKIFLDSEDPEDAISIEIGLGHLCPAQETRGLQERLENLGYEVGKIDGELGPKTRASIERFRKEFNVSGDDEESLWRALEAAHGA